MTHHETVKIVAFVGLAGSGKSSAVEYLTKKGYPKVYFGGIILDGLTKLGLDHNQENEKKFREEARAREGKDFVAQRIVTQIRDLINAGQRRIVADGLYSWTEYKVLKHEFPGEVTLVAIVAPKHLRYHRMATRPVRPLTAAETQARDWAEIENSEKGGPIAIADYYIMNSDDLDHFHAQLDDHLEHFNFYS